MRRPFSRYFFGRTQTPTVRWYLRNIVAAKHQLIIAPRWQGWNAQHLRWDHDATKIISNSPVCARSRGKRQVVHQIQARHAVRLCTAATRG